ncbi:MAG: DUF1963 domain-containing protein, partial [Phormidesmis sp.]
RKTAPISICDYQWTALTGFNPLAQGPDERNIAEGEFWLMLDSYSQQFSGHRLGGYPLFNQNDPRLGSQDDEPYVLLLQIDSEANGKIDILWGDAGICNFFIKPSALKKLDFSDVLYNWDCG